MNISEILKKKRLEELRESLIEEKKQSTNIGVRLTEELKKKLLTTAKKLDISSSLIIRAVLEQFLTMSDKDRENFLCRKYSNKYESS